MRRLPWVLAVCSFFSLCDCGTSPRSPADAGQDAGEDAGQDAGCAVQGALLLLGADAGGEIFADDFTCAAALDLDASTAVFDFGGTGTMNAPQARMLLDVGDGGEGAFDSDAGDVFTAGTHQYAGLSFNGPGEQDVDGDLTLRVAGPLNIANGAQLKVLGNLSIAASGPILICGGLYVAGDLVLQQPSDAGITFGCGTTYGYAYTSTQSNLTPVSEGNIEVDTRGALSIPRGYLYSGNFGSGASARSGTIALRSYGDLTLGVDGGSDGYAYVGDVCDFNAGSDCGEGINGDMLLYSEGKVSLLQSSYLYAGNTSAHGPFGANVELHAVNGIYLDDSYVYAGSDGMIEFLSQGPIELENRSYGYSGYYSGPDAGASNVHLRGDTIIMNGRSYFYAGGDGGSVALESAGDLSLDGGSYLYAGAANCATGGAVTLLAQGDIEVVDGSYVQGGDSRAGGNCDAGMGGSVEAQAAGIIAATPVSATLAALNPGAGSPDGGVSATASAPVVIGLLDAALEPSVQAVSVAMPSSAFSLLYGSLFPNAYFGAHLLVSSDGTGEAFQPLADRLGKPLVSGWRAKVLLQPRMFDAASVDGVIVRYRSIGP